MQQSIALCFVSYHNHTLSDKLSEKSGEYNFTASLRLSRGWTFPRVG